MMLSMDLDLWEDFRDRTRQATELPGYSRKHLAELAGLAPTTLGEFLNTPGQGLQPKTYKKLRPVVDALVPPTADPRHMSGMADRDVVELTENWLPIVDLDDFSFDAEGDAMERRLEDETLERMSVPGAARKRGDILIRVRRTIKLQRGTLSPGDLILANRHRTAAAGRVALLAIGQRGHFADIEDLEGELFAVLPGGKRLRTFHVAAVVRYKLEDWS